MVRSKDILHAAVNARIKSLQLQECFDPNNLDSRPNEAQTLFFKEVNDIKYRYLIGGNGSGKSQTGGRELTWLIQDTHPYWSMPKDWKERPLQVLVVGKSRDILENELWLKKVKPFFDPNEWREIRKGNSLSAVESRAKGHRIIFLTHSDGSQRAVDNLQAYDADIVWLDEMPAKLAVLEETQRRTRRPNTLWFATFTPKAVRIKIRKFIDSAQEPIAKRYFMSRLDVPGVDKEAELKALSGLSKNQRDTILEGAWPIGDQHVVEVDADTMCVELPPTYSKTWRHVECTDPGSNRGGFTLWAEDPLSKVWYAVKALYIDGLRDPVAFYDKCQAETAGYNIVRRICDPASTPHLGHSVSRKCSPPYTTPYAKTHGRKGELIKNFQHAMTSGKIKFIESECSEFIDEMSSAQWNEAGTKIVNSHAYHLMDCGQYFVDMIPKPEVTSAGMTRDEYILMMDDMRRAEEAKQYEKQNKKYTQDKVMKILQNIRGSRWI